MEVLWIETIAIMGMYNRSPSTIVHSLNLRLLLFHMVIKAWCGDN